MQANWSLVLNVIFLLIIVSMIFWRLRPYFNQKKSDKMSNRESSPSIDMNKRTYQDGMDDILNVRKIDVEKDYEIHMPQSETPDKQPHLGLDLAESATSDVEVETDMAGKHTIMLFLAAKGQNIFAGYELLQTLLSCGMRFGDGGLFHRHQHASGQGPVLFSLAAATATGVFDLQNMGAMSVKGLCVFMELSGNITIDQERFAIFIQTAKHLTIELNANLLDDKQRAVTDASIAKLEKMIAQEMMIDM